MKNLFFFLSMFTIGFTALANSHESETDFMRDYDGNAYVFIEGNVEFSIFSDGQFDFVYVGPQKGTQITISSPNTNISFNSGYNYDAYVQYDDYGAVIQIENVPIYYDEYGRIVAAGNVDISYDDRRIVRIGGMHVIYNNFGYFSHYTGFINPYNPYYVYRPWHVYYARPLYTHVIVYDFPYRRHYQPVRYTYQDHIRYYRNRGRVAYQNTRREFYRPGSRIHHNDGRVVKNNDFNPNRRNTMIAANGRNGQPVRASRVDGSNNTSNNTRINDKTKRENSGTRTGNHSGNNTRINTIAPNVRTNSAATVRAANTRTAVSNAPVRQNNSVSNTKNVRNARTPSTTPVVRESRTVPTRNISNASTVRKTSSLQRQSPAVNSSMGTSRQNNTARTRG